MIVKGLLERDDAMWGGGYLQTFLALALCLLLLIFYSTPLSMVVDVVMEEEVGVQMKLCPCKRVLPRNVNLEEVALNATTCGEDAWRRGRHQRVIAFTFFEATDGRTAEEKENRQYLQVKLMFRDVGALCQRGEGGV